MQYKTEVNMLGSSSWFCTLQDIESSKDYQLKMESAQDAEAFQEEMGRYKLRFEAAQRTMAVIKSAINSAAYASIRAALDGARSSQKALSASRLLSASSAAAVAMRAAQEVIQRCDKVARSVSRAAAKFAAAISFHAAASVDEASERVLGRTRALAAWMASDVAMRAAQDVGRQSKRASTLAIAVLEERDSGVHRCEFSSPFEGGVLHWIAVGEPIGGVDRHTYSNPHGSEQVVAKMSSVYIGNPMLLVQQWGGDNSEAKASEPHNTVASFITDSLKKGEMVTNCTANVRESWISVDLTAVRTLVLKHYCLRHGTDVKDGRLRNWQLQASNDEVEWATLMTHTKDKTLAEEGWAVGEWAVDTCNVGYRYFRVLQKGMNSDGIHMLCCAGIELYGDVHLAPDYFLERQLGRVTKEEERRSLQGRLDLNEARYAAEVARGWKEGNERL
jgi:hypothetical protein